jgi:flagellin
MSLFINTNINSLNAQRNLTRSQSDVSTALQRLSSGLRINSAKDDAAGLAIANRFTSQINGLNQAVRNANDGVSLAQTTGSALSEVTNNLQRIRTLAVESANATNSSSDRSALDQEVQQRIAEISRIANQTTFNGLKVLDGSFGDATFQVGANVGDTISVDLSTGVGASQIGHLKSATVEGSSVDFSGGNVSIAKGDVTIAVGKGDAVSVPAGDYSSMDDVVSAINGAGIEGLTASNDNGALQLTADAAITIAGSGANKIGLSAGTTQPDAPDNKSLADVDVLSVTDANDAIQRVDAALTKVNQVDSTLGAIQNRFESTISNLQAVSQNLSAARSRIQDADFAKETAALTRGQILQNAGISVLSQANAAPQSVLKLLQ